MNRHHYHHILLRIYFDNLRSLFLLSFYWTYLFTMEKPYFLINFLYNFSRLVFLFDYHKRFYTCLSLINDEISRQPTFKCSSVMTGAKFVSCLFVPSFLYSISYGQIRSLAACPRSGIIFSENLFSITLINLMSNLHERRSSCLKKI